MSGAPSHPDIDFSLEIFPPKTDVGEARLQQVLRTFYELKPAFISVTSASRRSVADFTWATSNLVHEEYGKVAPHITCSGKSRAEIERLAAGYRARRISRIVALRGDAPPRGARGSGNEPLRHAVQLVRQLKRIADFDISVAAYPETHPEASSAAADLAHLKEKVDAGANRAISQFFFDPDVFLRFRDRVVAAGVSVPLVPGLLPILNFERMTGFADKCNADVPQFLRRMFEGLQPQSLDHKLLAMNILSYQIGRLIAEGVTRFHFYTLNETTLIRHVCRWMRMAF